MIYVTYYHIALLLFYKRNKPLEVVCYSDFNTVKGVLVALCCA